MFERLMDLILGVRVIRKDDAIYEFQKAVDECDVDGDGFLSLRELIRLFRVYAKEVGKE